MSLLMALSLTSFISCKTGCHTNTSAGKQACGGNGSPRNDGRTFHDLAIEFVTDLNVSLGLTDIKYRQNDIMVKLVKYDTDQMNYIVIKNVDESYTAINIQGFEPGVDNPLDYLERASTYNNLRFEDGGEYWDSIDEVHRDREDYFYNSNGLRFEKVSGSSKDLAKIVAIKEAFAEKTNAEILSQNLGLSMERSLEISRLHSHWAKATKKSMTDKEMNNYSSELLGFGIKDLQKASIDYMSGDDRALDELILKSSEKNNISPEHARKIMESLL